MNNYNECTTHSLLLQKKWIKRWISFLKCDAINQEQVYQSPPYEIRERYSVFDVNKLGAKTTHKKEN